MKKNLLTLDVALSKEIKYMLKEEHYLPGQTAFGTKAGRAVSCTTLNCSWSLESVTSR